MMSGYTCMISIASRELDCKKNLRLCRHSNLNNPIQLVFKEVVSFLDILQLIAVGDQRGGIDLALFDQAENLGAVAAVDATGFEGQIFAVHLRQRQRLSFAGKVRVNSVSPGWIDTAWTVYEGPDAIQQPAGRVGNPMDIANMVLFLASDKAGFITGENICIDGGQTRLMIYHGDHGWTLNP